MNGDIKELVDRASAAMESAREKILSERSTASSDLEKMNVELELLRRSAEASTRTVSELSLRNGKLASEVEVLKARLIEQSERSDVSAQDLERVIEGRERDLAELDSVLTELNGVLESRMPEVNIVAGSRTYSVECEPHELDDALVAAAVLNAELANVSKLFEDERKSTPATLFMFAGLRLAGKFAEASETAKKSEANSANSKELPVPDGELLARLTRITELAEEIDRSLSEGKEPGTG